MRRFVHLILILGTIQSFSQPRPWPVLKRYSDAHLARIAMPVGGVGTGTISFAGNGQWKDVEIMNKPGKGFYGATTPKQAPCFMIFTQDNSGRKISKALMGPLTLSEYEGMEGAVGANHGLPRFRQATFEVAYPFAQVALDDPGMPVSVRAKTFNPFIPGDPDASGIPLAIIRYEVSNKSAQPLTVAVAGSLDNFIGMDGSQYDVSDFNKVLYPKGARKNRNTFRKGTALTGIFMTSDSVDRKSDAWGTIALTTNEKLGISYRTELEPKGWNANVNDLWDDFSDDGVFRDTTFQKKVDVPRAALSVKFNLAPGEVREIQFLLTWNFPNRKDWYDKEGVTLGNYYSTRYNDAWDVAEKTYPQLPVLEKTTLNFVNLLLQSSYPDVVKEAALFNASTLRSQTTFRTSDGNFFGWEGIFNSIGSCHGNCTHVWNYEQASPFLFGALAKKMREIEYDWALDDSGLMSFRVSLPLNKKKNAKLAAADGQMGTIMKMYREWQLSGDDEFLRKRWPAVKKALSFSWIPGGWDADRDGVMEGCQHNTMDIEYFGPNPEIEFWYLGALKAASKMAHFMKDKEFEATCTRLFDNGSKWTDANLFNGEYYIQKIIPIPDRSKIAAGLIIGMGASDLSKPDFQIGEGCLVDQLVGQYMAHICGLGYLADSTHIKKTMQSIWKYNYVKNFEDHFNNMRTYGLGDESGLALAAYPIPEKRPKIPFSYYNEVWTGLEYTAAAGMVYEGMENEGIQTVVNVRSRFDGLKRNPFDEAECGHHYARAMASWSMILALSGFNYSAVDQKLTVTSKPGTYFWSNGYAWGSFTVKESGSRTSVNLSVEKGSINLKSLIVGKKGEIKFKQTMNMGGNGMTAAREFWVETK